MDGLSQSFDANMKQIERTESLQADAVALRQLTLRASSLVRDQHERVRNRLLTTARVLPLGIVTLRKAERLRKALGLHLADAVMLASVLLDARARPGSSIFLNSNSHDFADPGVQKELKKRDCTLLTNFENGLKRIEHHIAVRDGR
jgi:hypothetical protein